MHGEELKRLELACIEAAELLSDEGWPIDEADALVHYWLPEAIRPPGGVPCYDRVDIDLDGSCFCADWTVARSSRPFVKCRRFSIVSASRT